MEIGGRKNDSNDSDCLRRSCRYSVSGVGCNADKEFLGGVEVRGNESNSSIYRKRTSIDIRGNSKAKRINKKRGHKILARLRPHYRTSYRVTPRMSK